MVYRRGEAKDMYQFKDLNNCDVKLTFEPQGFCKEPKHVWVICRYQDQWLLTNHPKRGWEFPGGKVEDDEEPTEAARREVWEETGAQIESLYYIGQYEVNSGTCSFYKNIYFAKVSSLFNQVDYQETNGPILLDSLPIKMNTSFSFMMQDQVLPLSLKQIAKMQLL
jgi:8-oxo-dGTP diphosphatase